MNFGDENQIVVEQQGCKVYQYMLAKMLTSKLM